MTRYVFETSDGTQVGLCGSCTPDPADYSLGDVLHEAPSMTNRVIVKITRYVDGVAVEVTE